MDLVSCPSNTLHYRDAVQSLFQSDIEHFGSQTDAETAREESQTVCGPKGPSFCDLAPFGRRPQNGHRATQMALDSYPLPMYDLLFFNLFQGHYTRRYIE